MTHDTSNHARDDQGRTIGTVHDFQGWCTLPAGHDDPHAVNEARVEDYTSRCGVPVALIGDLTNWKPTGFLNTPGAST